MAGLAHHLQRLRIWTLPTERIGLPSRIGARHPRAGLVVFYNDLRAAKRPAIDDGNFVSFPAQGVDAIRIESLFHPQFSRQPVARRRAASIAPAVRLPG